MNRNIIHVVFGFLLAAMAVPVLVEVAEAVTAPRPEPQRNYQRPEGVMRYTAEEKERPAWER